MFFNRAGIKRKFLPNFPFLEFITMGVDVSSSSGVLAETDDMLKLITGKTKKAVLEICQDFYNELESQVADNPDQSWYQETRDYFKALNNIQAKTIGDLREIVGSVVQVSGKPGKYDLDTHVVHSEYLQDLFSKIVGAYADAHDVELPYLEEVNAWGSSRYNGWDVPLGVVCFVFDEDSCFEKAISQSGKDLKKIIGHCNVTEWTEYSC